MKFLVITAIREFENEIKQILKKSHVHAFSYQEVTGYKNPENESVEDNWFGADLQVHESLMFYAFLEEAYLEGIFQRVAQFNVDQKTASRIHLAVLNIEKTN